MKSIQLTLFGILLLTATLLGLQPAYAQFEMCWRGDQGTVYNCSLNIEPQSPTEMENLIVSFIGDHGDSCIPAFDSIEQTENVINIHLEHRYPADIACLAVISPFEYEFDLGKVDAGSYQINGYINDDLVASTGLSIRANSPSIFFPFVTNVATR